MPIAAVLALTLAGATFLGQGHAALSQPEARRAQAVSSSPYLTLATGVCANAVTVTASMTSSQYFAVVNDIKALLAAQNQTCAGSTCPVAQLAGCIVRMAGHDFMDYLPTAISGQTGGADGCIDFTDSDNGGLSDCLASGQNLGLVYAKYCTTLSLADFIVLAAEAVMILRSQCNPVYYDSRVVPPNCSNTDCGDQKYATSYNVPFCSAGKLDMTYMASQFRYGRVTNTQCSWAHGRLPNVADGCTANQDVFITRMGLTWEEVTALMGVHTLGSAEINNSGYNGWWSDVQNSSFFNNDYYVSLLTKGWAPQLAVNGNPRKSQWTRTDGASGNVQMMLDTDMCLVYTFRNSSNLSNSTTAVSQLHAANSSCCAWIDKDALTGCRRGRFQANDPMQCWDEALDQNITAMCGTRGNCCASRTARGLPNCGSIVQPMEAPAWNLIKSQSGTFTSYDQFRLYATNSTRWYQDFLLVWAKATAVGQRSLKCIDDLCITTTTTATTTRTTTGTRTVTTTKTVSSTATVTKTVTMTTTKTTATATATATKTTTGTKTSTTANTQSTRKAPTGAPAGGR